MITDNVVAYWQDRYNTKGLYEFYELFTRGQLELWLEMSGIKGYKIAKTDLYEDDLDESNYLIKSEDKQKLLEPGCINKLDTKLDLGWHVETGYKRLEDYFNQYG